MKDKKDGKNRALHTNEYTVHQNNSPLATSTTEKDDFTHRSYSHHHSYYQPSMSGTYQSQIDYNPLPERDNYERTTNYDIKQSNYYTPIPPTSYDNYYFNSQNSTIHHQ